MAVRASEAGSKPRRSVKRQCSSAVDGRGSSSNRFAASSRVSVASVAAGVAAVQDELIAVRVGEERHVAHARVEDVAVELDALRLELLPRLVHVRRRAARSLRRAARGTRRRSTRGSADRGSRCRRACTRESRRHWSAAGRACRGRRRFERSMSVTGTAQKSTCSTTHLADRPSIWSWISRFISTAYSSGSSFVIGSTKPLTTIADASASERPRDIR